MVKKADIGREKVLLTGVTGLVGAAFVVALVKNRRNVDFVCVARGRSGKTAQARVEEALRAECEFEGCENLCDEVLSAVSVVDGDVSRLDTRELAGCRQIKNIDKIFHCAADVNLGKDPTGRVFRANYEGTLQMVELAKRIGAREFHLVSTAYVVGDTKGKVMESAVSADRAFNNPYEDSKCKAEMLVRESGIPFTIYRPGIIVGRKSDGRIRKALAFYRILEFLQKLKGRTAARSGVSPSDWMDMDMNCGSKASPNIYFVPIDYVSDAISTLFFFPANGETYHLTGGTPVTANQILEATCSVFRLDGVSIGLEREYTTENERVFSKYVGDLFPYFASDIVFDQSNINRDWPEGMNRRYGYEDLERMVRAYLLDNFHSVEWVRQMVSKPAERRPMLHRR